MSIINAVRSKKNKYGSYNQKASDRKPTKSPKIHDLSVLKDYIKKVCNFMKLDDEKIKDLQSNGYSDFRRYQYVVDWFIPTTVGYVDEPTWVYIIESAVEWVADSYGAIQPNGDWRLEAFELTVEDRVRTKNQFVGQDENGRIQTTEISEQNTYLVLGLQYVDINGERDLVYDMGRPTTRNEQFDPKLMKQLMANAGQNQSSDGDSQKLIAEQAAKIAEQDKALESLRTEQTKMTAMMAELLQEMKQDTSKSSGRSKK